MVVLRGDRRRLERGRSRQPDVDLLTSACGLVLTGGVFLDTRAHAHKIPDSFLTPWHAVLYAGFFATAWSIGRYAPRGPTSPYRLSFVGIATFAGGGVADAMWHTLRGPEKGLAVPVSPPHLLLFVGGALMVSGPVRSALRRPGTTIPWATVLSLASLATSAAFPGRQLVAFAQRWDLPEQVDAAAALRHVGHAIDVDQLVTATILPRLVVTTLLVSYPVLFALRWWRLRPGAVAVVVGTLVLMASGTRDYEAPAVLVGALAAAVAMDVAVRALGAVATGDRLLRLAAIVVPALLWIGTLGGAWASGRLVGASFELWSGSACVSVLASIALAELVVVHDR